jgi:hypothetical protein
MSNQELNYRYIETKALQLIFQTSLQTRFGEINEHAKNGAKNRKTNPGENLIKHESAPENKDDDEVFNRRTSYHPNIRKSNGCDDGQQSL